MNHTTTCPIDRIREAGCKGLVQKEQFNFLLISGLPAERLGVLILKTRQILNCERLCRQNISKIYQISLYRRIFDIEY
jgi:hypothetical protein